MEVNLEWCGFYKKVSIPDDYPYSYIDIAIIPPMREVVSAMMDIPEDVIRTKRMRFERDIHVRTLYKFWEVL